MRDEEARRCRFPGRKAQAARWRQFRLVEDADDGGKALRPETFFDGIQSFARPRRLDDDEARRIKTQAEKPRRRWRAEFAGKRPRPAPQHPRSSSRMSNRRLSVCPLGRRKCIDPADSKAGSKSYPCHPVGRRSPMNGRRFTLDFVKGVRLEPSRQQPIRRRTAKLPPQPPR